MTGTGLPCYVTAPGDEATRQDHHRRCCQQCCSHSSNSSWGNRLLLPARCPFTFHTVLPNHPFNRCTGSSGGGSPREVGHGMQMCTSQNTRPSHPPDHAELTVFLGAFLHWCNMTSTWPDEELVTNKIQGFLVSHHILSLKLQMTSKFSFIYPCPELPSRPEWESLLKTLTTEINQNIKLKSKYKIEL